MVRYDVEAVEVVPLRMQCCRGDTCMSLAHNYVSNSFIGDTQKVYIAPRLNND